MQPGEVLGRVAEERRRHVHRHVQRKADVEGLVVPANQVGVAIPANSNVISSLSITDNFLIKDVNLQLNISHTNVPDLEARLVAVVAVVARRASRS